MDVDVGGGLSRLQHEVESRAMALAPGTKLGPYEVLAPLGAGGVSKA